LASIGLLVIHAPLYGFIELYKTNMQIFFENYWNSVYTSPTRIDIDIIAARLFPERDTLSTVISTMLKLFFTVLFFLYLFKSQKDSNWRSSIYLS
jgi:hypothetical protein